jgi:hypothetical protein
MPRRKMLDPNLPNGVTIKVAASRIKEVEKQRPLLI